MIRRKLTLYLLMAAMLPALTIALPTTEARAGSRAGAFVAGVVIGAAGAAAVHHHRTKRWSRTKRSQYARGYHPKPWTRAWYRYCSNKYRSFNSRTGYYTTYSGRKRFCR